MNAIKIISFSRLLTRRQHQAVIATLLLPILAAQPGRCQAPVIPEDVKANILTRVTNGFAPAIVVGIVNSSGSSFFNCGVRDLDTGEPVDEDSIFELGGITETLTCTVLSQLVLDGTLRLTNSVQSYLPQGVQVPSRSDKVITLEHLATHYSGLPGDPTNLNPTDPLNLYSSYTVQQMYDFLSSYQLPRDPGASFGGSVVGMGLLGHVLQLKTGSDYESLIAERITRPLGMTNTGVTPTLWMTGHWTKGYSGVVRMRDLDFAPALAGAGGLRASPRDLLRYVAANMGLVQTDLYAAMTNAQAVIRTFGASDFVGLAWFQHLLQGDRAVYLYGNTYGHSVFVGFLASQRLGVVVMSSCGCLQSIASIGEHLLDPTVSLVPVPACVAVQVESLHNRVGRYQDSSTGNYIDIGLQHGYLTIAGSRDEGYAFTLYPSSPGSFFSVDVVGSADFQTNSQGLATSLIWSQNGHSTTYNRVALPSRLAIHRVNGDNQITFSGDTGVDYILEATTDLIHWQPIATNTIWTQPVLDRNPSDARFYRLCRP